MIVRISVLVSYFLLVLLIGFVARTRWKATPDRYFLADRRLGTLVLLGTMVATNFSAFTVFGASGAGYRDGYAFFPIMALGTGFMALSFWVLGIDFWSWGAIRPLLWGVPWWLGYSVALSALQTGIMAHMVRREYAQKKQLTGGRFTG